MDLQTFSHQLSDLYHEMSSAFAAAQDRAKLPCLEACGQCCSLPETEASLWEMLPMAFALVEQGVAEAVLDDLVENPPQSCWAYRPSQDDPRRGSCAQYESRPTVCREFGVAAATDRLGATRLVVCKHIRESHRSQLAWAQEHINEWAPPLTNTWAMKLMTLHPQILNERHPISVSLREALNKVLLFKHLEK